MHASFDNYIIYITEAIGSVFAPVEKEIANLMKPQLMANERDEYVRGRVLHMFE